ncbi:Putative protein FAM90A23 [Cricetulus griseus]|nr:Putative protein FAM90A23 [Cricetulus griseus]
MARWVDSDTDIEFQNLENRRKPRERRVFPREENPRMKCKNCGAFGHTMRSKKCPIKSWDGAKVPLPLGIKKEKENQDPQKPKNLQSTEPVCETEEEKIERERLEQRRKALVLKFPKKPPEKKPQSWKDTTHSGDYLRRPSRPSFIHINKRSSLKSTETSLPSLKKSDGEHVCHTAPSTEKPNITLEVPNMPKPAVGHSDEHSTSSGNPTDQSTEHCFHQVPPAAFTQPPAQLLTQVIQNPPKKQRISTYQRPQKITEKPALEAFRVVPRSSISQVESKGLPQVTSVEQQPPRNRALLNFTQPFIESRHPLPSHAPVQPLRMVFTRLRNDCWSSRILEASSSHPPEKKGSSDKFSASLKQSEGPYPRVPLNIVIRARPPSSFEERK